MRGRQQRVCYALGITVDPVDHLRVPCEYQREDRANRQAFPDCLRDFSQS
jgi:hypothetical protein